MAKAKCNCNSKSKPHIGGIDDVIARIPLQAIGGSVAGLIAARFLKNTATKTKWGSLDPAFQKGLVGVTLLISGGYVMSRMTPSNSDLEAGFGIGWATEGFSTILEASGVPILQGIAQGDVAGMYRPTPNYVGNIPTIPSARGMGQEAYDL